MTKMHIANDDNLGISRLSHDVNYGDRDIKVTTFDKMIKKYDFEADLIKIDAEGSDIDIFYGMNEYLSNCLKKPIIIIEVNTNTISDDDNIKLINYLNKHKYTLVDYDVNSTSKDWFLIPEGFNY